VVHDFLHTLCARSGIELLGEICWSRYGLLKVFFLWVVRVKKGNAKKYRLFIPKAV
jgi:hypothetical protein